MDAREMREWLAMQIVRHEDTIIAVVPDDSVERRPMTDIEWQKLDVLYNVVGVSMDGLELAFVRNLRLCPYDYPITKRQAMFIERLWERFKSVHRGQLSAPRWIQDYLAKRLSANNRGTTFMSSRVGCFIEGILHPKDIDEMEEQDVIPTEITYFK